MLSFQATVYADSNDKYNSIFKISKAKKRRNEKNKKTNWDYYQYLNIVLHIYKCLEFGTRGLSSTYI